MRKPIPYVCPVCGSRLPRAAARCFFCENPLPLHKGAVHEGAPRLKRRLKGRAPSTASAGTDPSAQELPRLYVAVRDFGRLESLAYMRSSPDPSSGLLRRELDRAIVCDGNSVPHGVVRMGSTVLIHDRGEDGTMQKLRGVLVYPGECHPRLPSIPVSSPLGSAILGLSAGDTMPYEAGNGVRHVAMVLSVIAPETPHAATDQARDAEGAMA